MSMKYLLRSNTRAARFAVLRLRVHAILQADDVAELYLTLHYAFWAIVLALPGDTMHHAAAWRVIRSITAGDNGFAFVCGSIAAAMLPTLLRIVPEWWHRGALLLTLSASVGIAAGFLLGYPFALGPVDAMLCALLAWFAYLRVNGDIP